MIIKGIEKNYRLFFILFAVAFIFIVISVLLIFKINSVRSNVSDQVKSISLITKVELETFSVISSINGQTKIPELIDEMEFYLSKDFHLDTYPDLQDITFLLDGFREYLVRQGGAINKDAVIQKLAEIDTLCKVKISSSRSNLSVLSQDLTRYWFYTYVLIGFACLLSILMSLIGYSVSKTKHQLSRLSKQNKLLLNNSIDAVISCNATGNFWEFNSAAEKLFGYSFTELKSSNIIELYASEKEFQRVNDSLTEKGFFSGEILNRHKNGEVFTAYLSANLIHNSVGEVIGSMGISRNITEIKKLEDQFQHIVNNATDIIYTSNYKGKIIFINDSVFDVLGYSNSEVTDKNFDHIIVNEDKQMVVDFYKDQFDSGSSESYLEFRLYKKDGSKIWVGQNVKTIFTSSDKSRIAGYNGILRDINDRKQAELKVVDSERKYKQLFDNSSDLIHNMDTKGNILYVNKAWYNTLGYSMLETKNLNFFDLIDENSKDQFKLIFEETLVESKNQEKRSNFSITNKQGEILVVEGAFNSRINEGGEVDSIQAFLRDVTVEKEIEGELKKSEENYRQILEALNDTFYLYNIPEQKYEYISMNCKEILGVEQSLFYSGKQYSEIIIHEDDQEQVRKSGALILNGGSYEIDYRIINNGEVRWVNEKAFPIQDADGNIMLCSGICRDITEVKRTKSIIDRQNIEIGESILYAKVIQDSTLPTVEEITNLLPESFIFYRPKNVLSGDFYIVDQVGELASSDLITFVVGDCTGHGVPGGILSMLCNSLIKESYTKGYVNSPSEALDFVRKKLVDFFRSSQSKSIKDGMDAAFCVLDKAENKLHFSGAKSSCIVIRDDELTEYRGDKQHVGYATIQKPFTTHVIDVQKGDMIYLFTDGYTDQFGGPKNKKFMKKRLKEMLLTIHSHKSMLLQCSIIEETFIEWKSDYEQTDDVTLFGVRL